ncbi:MAG: patatin-like phospholipase family protein [Rubrivivax sp.]
MLRRTGLSGRCADRLPAVAAVAALVAAGLLALAAAGGARAQAQAPVQGQARSGPAEGQPQGQAQRPRIGLVLSGGGARGFAHIGVLQVLQELQVPVDIVVGTSMGAVVGGAYAAGRSAAELERFAQDTDWAGVLADRPARTAGSFRRRETDLEVPSRIEFGIGPDASLIGPPAVAGSQALELALERLLPPGQAQRPAGRLAVAFRAVATDLRTGELVELADEPLVVALRASLSVPGLFPPYARDGRLLVDGGLVRNVPVDQARALGAQVLIVVNVGTPVDHVQDLGSALGVAQQMINLLTEQNAQRSLSELRPADILIQPDLSRLDSSELASGATRAIAAGQAAARAVAERLRALGVGPQAWESFETVRTQQPAALGTADSGRLFVRPTGRAGAQLLAASAGVPLGQPVDAAQARAAADRLYASGDFERVEVQSALLPDGRALILVPVQAPWRRHPLRLGLELQTEQGNREDATSFSATAMTTFSPLNAWGGELRALLRLGSRTTVMGEWWQPLGPGVPWFGLASWRRDAGSQDVYVAGNRVSWLGVGAGITRLAAGMAIGRLGDVQVGLERTHWQIDPLLASPTPIDLVRLSYRRVFGQLRLDSLDSVAFPTRGVLLQATWRSRTIAGLPSDAEAEVRGMAGFRMGRWAGHVYADASRAEGGFAPLALGGFLRLSGTPKNSLDGRSSLLGRVVMGVPIGRMPVGLGGPVRAGFSLELGGLFPVGESVSVRELKLAGSTFMSVDTLFGPVYFALGATHRGGRAAYVFLGPFW